jgi:hypothetical protein
MYIRVKSFSTKKRRFINKNVRWKCFRASHRVVMNTLSLKYIVSHHKETAVNYVELMSIVSGFSLSYSFVSFLFSPYSMQRKTLIILCVTFALIFSNSSNKCAYFHLQILYIDPYWDKSIGKTFIKASQSPNHPMKWVYLHQQCVLWDFISSNYTQ